MTGDKVQADASGPLAGEGGWPRARLDVDYDARASVGQGFGEEMAAYQSLSHAQRQAWLRHEDIVYDAPSGQAMDIYGPPDQASPKPVFLFIHGGYWRALSKQDSAMMAGALGRNGFMSAIIDYTLAPQASLREIVRQVRASLTFLHENGHRYGIDGTAIHVGGSSAGAHLAASLLCGAQGQPGLVPAGVVRSATLLSGLYDLAPIASAFPQEWLSLDAAAIADLSPIRHLPEAGCPVLIAWAECEPAGFKRQSGAFHAAWTGHGFQASAAEIERRNHFNLLLDLGHEESRLGRMVLDLLSKP